MVDANRDELKPLLPASDNLASLEIFNHRAFLSDDKKEQDACNFALMLALTYNDFKDLLWAYSQLNGCQQPDPSRISGYNGQFLGMRGHLTRLFHSLICELCVLLREQGTQLDHPLFKKAYGLLSKESKLAWDGLNDFAHGRTNEKSLAFQKISVLIRNNIGFHYYQPKFLAGGYLHFFTDQSSRTRQHAFISRGSDLAKTRFYFADAAVEGSFEKYIGPDKADEIRPSMNAVTSAMNHSIYDLVTSFIQSRGFAWEKHRE